MRKPPTEGQGKPHGHHVLRVLVDENLYIPKGEQRLRLSNQGIALNTVDEVDLRSTANGELQDAAYGMGFRALVTFDKMMADQAPPQFPVLVFDEVP